MSVLVVDDDPDVRAFVAEALEIGGYTVETAEHGAVGLERVRRARPDLVVLDLMMPIMDGWTFLHECRHDARCRCVPVVILSAASNLRADAAADLGVAAVMKKPFELDELLGTIERVVAQA